MNQIETAASMDLEHSAVGELVHSRATGAQWLSRYSSSLLGVFGTPQRVAHPPCCSAVLQPGIRRSPS